MPSPLIAKIERFSHCALKPSDFKGLTPKLNIKEGDEVVVGDPLFHDKSNPKIVFTSPVAGVVDKVVRGAKRRIASVVVKANKQQTFKDFGIGDPKNSSTATIKAKILESGCWAFIKQRPYDIIANPADQPKAIFVSSFDSHPLSNDYSFSLSSKKEDFKVGLEVLSKLTEGDVHVGLDQEVSFFESSCEGIAQTTRFIGKHPAGNVGTQIAHINPINQGERVWVVNAQDVTIIGALFRTGNYMPYRNIALVGSQVDNPCYYQVTIGQGMGSIIRGKIDETHPYRIISGNVLTGSKVTKDGFIGFYDNEITVIPEGKIHRFLGWIPFVGSRSVHSNSRTSFSWLFSKTAYQPNTNLNGEERAMVVTGEMERVMPMDIYPMQLLKAALAKDIEKMEQLGIYEVAPEDFALIDYISSSKIEAQEIIREGIDLMIKEVG